MKRYWLFSMFLVFAVLLNACTAKTESLPYNVRVRLSINNTSNWGEEAIGVIVVSKNDCLYSPRIIVLDTGCNIESELIAIGYNAFDGSEDVADADGHGTVMIDKLLDMIVYADVVPIKISDSEEIALEYLLGGLEKAISMHPDVISMSLGTMIDYPKVAEKIEEAIEQNIVVIAAAGNQGGDKLLYPAGYDDVISVLARDINNIDVASNNKSESKRSFSAPGVKILVGNEYVTGSSIAVPYVTALISQMIAVSGKGRLLIAEIENILVDTALYPTKFSFGLVQYNMAIKETMDKHAAQ